MPKYIDLEKLKGFDFCAIFGNNASYATCLGIEAVLMVAEKMPPADVQEVVHSKWVEEKSRVLDETWCPTLVTHYRCLHCGRLANEKTPWCAHCGAKMSEET